MEPAYKDVFSLSPFATIITDTAGTIVQVNQRAEHLFQYESDSLIGDKISLIVPLHYFDKSIHRNANPTNPDVVEEFLATCKNGIGVPVEMHSVVIETNGESLISWTATNISRTKELLADLKERAKERLTLLLVTEALFKAESLEKIFEQTLSPIAEGLQHPEHTAVRIKLMDGAAFQTDNFLETEWKLSSIFTYNTKEYGTLEVYYTKRFPYYLDSPFLNEERELIDALSKLFSIFLDQWYTVKRLQEKEFLIRKITEQIPGNTYQFELDAAGEITFLFASKGTAADNVGFNAEEMRTEPQKILRLLHPDDRERFQETMKVAYANSADIDVQYRVLAEGVETWRWLKATSEKKPDGKVVWYGCTQDITQIINYIGVLEEILFDISHVMRKPVATMLGLTHYLVDHDNMDEKTIRDFAIHIRTVATEIDTYITSLNNSYLEKRHMVNKTTGKLFSHLHSKNRP